jgi:hypothetical protein
MRLLGLAKLLPAALALSVWWKLRNALYHIHWGQGPTIFLLILASIALVLAVPRLARLVAGMEDDATAPAAPGEAARATRRGRLVAGALAALALWSLGDELRELRAGMAQERPRLIDVGDVTWMAMVHVFDRRENPYTQRLQPHSVSGRPGVTERDGRVEIYGVPYFYGFAYFPGTFLSYVPFRFIDPGRQSIRIGNAFWLAVLLIGVALLTYRLAPERWRLEGAALAALLLAITTGLGGQLFFFGVTDLMVPGYVVLALVATSYRRPLLAGVLMGLALAAKLLPALLFALVYFVWLFRRDGFGAALASFTLTTTLVLLPFVLWHPGAFLSATLLFYLVHHGGGDSTSLWYFLPHLLRVPFRAVGGIAVLAVVLWPLWSRRRDERDLVRTMVVASLLFLAVSPMIHLNWQFAVVPLACVALAADAVSMERPGRAAALMP